jgi:DNA-binding CsgD family transcriptional regulator
LSKHLVSSEPPQESETPPPAPAIGVLERSPAAAALLDENDRLVMASEQALVLLRALFGAEGEAPPALDALSDGFRAHAHTLRRAIETSNLPFRRLTPDLVCRGSMLRGDAAAYLLVLFELGTRRSMVQDSLDAYGLTPREREVAELVLEGLTNKVIADRLTLAEYTVETHVKRILTKVDVRTRSAFAAKVLAFQGG